MAVLSEDYQRCVWESLRFSTKPVELVSHKRGRLPYVENSGICIYFSVYNRFFSFSMLCVVLISHNPSHILYGIAEKRDRLYTFVNGKMYFFLLRGVVCTFLVVTKESDDR